MTHIPVAASAALIGVVALIALALAIVGFVSRNRSRNRKVAWVATAFAVFAAKNAFSAWAIYTGSVSHADLELYLAIIDLVVLALLVTPLFLP
ncbi:MAG: hypothetical protein ACYDDF_13595 [Thermoplasmatota archaeon]